MSTEVIVAIITGSCTIIAALIAGIFSIVKKKSKHQTEQKIEGNGNVQAGGNVIIGDLGNEKTNNKRK